MNSILARLRKETWRSPFVFLPVWVPTLTVFILSFDPALTADLALLQRVAFWLLHVGLLLPLLMITQNLIDERLAGTRIHPFGLVALAAVVASAAFAPISLLLDLLFSPATDLAARPGVPVLFLDEVSALALPTLCVWLLVNGVRLSMLSVPLLQEAPTTEGDRTHPSDNAVPPANAKPAVTLTEAEKAFWSKVPRELGVDLVSLSSEQHYLHVATTKGRSLILFPISRAIDAVGRLDGMRIHRSHWVALKHVLSVARDETSLSLTLSSGETLPVSRANRLAVQDALDADKVRRAPR